MMKKSFLLLLCLASLIAGSAQDRVKLDSMISSLKLINEDSSKVKLLISISLKYIRSDEFKTAKKYAVEALLLAQKLNFKKGQAGSLRAIGLTHLGAGEYNEAITNFRSSLHISIEIGDMVGVIQGHGDIASIYLLQENYPEALKHYLTALTLSEKNNEKDAVIGYLIYIGKIHLRQENTGEALTYFLDALMWCNRTGKETGLGACYSNIGSCYSKLANYDEALKYYNLSLNYHTKTGDVRTATYMISYIGKIYTSLGDYSKALSYQLKALMGFKSLDDSRGIAFVYKNIGSIYSAQNRCPEAIMNYQTSLKFHKDGEDKRLVATDYLIIGELYLRQSRPDSAQYYARKSLEISKELGSLAKQRDAYKMISQIDSARGDYQSAYQSFKLYMLFNDSIFNIEKDKKLTQLSLEYTFRRTQDSISFEQSKKDSIYAYEKLLKEEKLVQQQKDISLQETELRFNNQALLLANNEIDIKTLEFLKEKAEKQEKTALLAAAEKESALQASLITNIRNNRNMIFGILGMCFLLTGIFFYYRNNQKKYLLLRQISEVEMKALRTQINPHFIFNSLNSIYSYIQINDYVTASDYLIRFSKLIRQILENSMSPLITLKEELEVLNLYLGLESERLKSKFVYEIKLDREIEPSSLLVPPMILQPYIENSIWHGMKNMVDGGVIEINIQRSGDLLHCTIADNGGGIQKDSEPGKRSFGTNITEQRLSMLNHTKKTRGYVSINNIREENSLKSGVRVELAIPVEMA